MDDPEDYEVGYKRPPKHSQFKPGESGHSRARKQILQEDGKVPRTLNEVVRKVARKPVSVKEGDSVRDADIPTLIVERFLKNALNSNNPRLIKGALEILSDAEAFGDRPMTHDELVRTLTREEINQIDEIQEILARYSNYGDPSSDEADK